MDSSVPPHGSTKETGSPNLPGEPRGRRSPVRRRGIQTRAKLLEAAETTFKRVGYMEWRVADVVSEAHVGYGTFYRYFESKEDIFAEMVSRRYDEMFVALNADNFEESGAERIRAANRRYAALFEEHSWLIDSLEEASAVSSDMRLLRSMVRQGQIDRIDRSIRQMVERGNIAVLIGNTTLMAEALGSMTDGVLLRWIATGKQISRDEVIETINQVWMRSLGFNY